MRAPTREETLRSRMPSSSMPAIAAAAVPISPAL